VSRSWELFLRDMLEAARKVIRFTADRQFEPSTIPLCWKIVHLDIPRVIELLKPIERELP
jgi:uncharacterized protein with HEPN domain